jgi:hypothetical protein
MPIGDRRASGDYQIARPTGNPGLKVDDQRGRNIVTRNLAADDMMNESAMPSRGGMTVFQSRKQP